MMIRFLMLGFIFGIPSWSLALDPAVVPKQLVRDIDNAQIKVWPVGVTASNTAIEAVIHLEDLNYSTRKTRVLLVGDSSWASRSIGDAMAWFYKSDAAAELRGQFVISALPLVHPGRPWPKPTIYPPPGKYYSAADPAPAYVWRWIGMHAPDLVVEVHPAKERRWYIPTADDLQGHLEADALSPASDQRFILADALVLNKPGGTGRISAVGVETSAWGSSKFLVELLGKLKESSFRGPSPARKELQSRAARSPIEIAGQLSRVYGQQLNSVAYIPSLALVGRLRLGELAGDTDHAEDVRRIVAPYFEGKKPTGPKNGSALSGHLIFSELAERTDKDEPRARYLKLARHAADLGFSTEGLKPSMPFHSEMSDALFMGGPILAHLGKLTGDERYFEMCLRHLRFMRKLVLRDDGIYRHSPLDEAAWGRGNGFPALGLALCLKHWPRDRPDRDDLLKMFRSHLSALAKHQDQSGCWHQVIDQPTSYREFTCTCMITFAAALGAREGWLDREQFDPIIRRGWAAIRLRIASDGQLVDVCTGTGKQRSLADYYHRTAILGKDDRGGAMALMAATELAIYLD